MGGRYFLHRVPLAGPLGVDYEVTLWVVGGLGEHAEVALVLSRYHLLASPHSTRKGPPNTEKNMILIDALARPARQLLHQLVFQTVLYRIYILYNTVWKTS